MSRLLPKPSMDGAGNAATLPSESTAPNQVPLPTYILVPVKAVTQSDFTRDTPAGAGDESAKQSISTVCRQKRLPVNTEGMKKRTKYTIAVDGLQLRLPVATGSYTNAVSEMCRRCVYPVDEPCLAHSLIIKDRPIVPRALASLPAELYIAQKDGMLDVGVFAKTRIPHPTVFGPLVGPAKESISPVKHRFALCEKNEAGETVQVFDLDCDELCNWMKFTREAVDRVQRNVVAFCENNSVYFATTEDILPDSELLFWYSKRYAKVLEDHGLLEKKLDGQENDSVPLCYTGDEYSAEELPCVPDENISLARRSSNVKTAYGQMKGSETNGKPGKEIRKALSVIRAKMRNRRCKTNLQLVAPRRGKSFWMCSLDGCTMGFRDKITREIHKLRHQKGQWNITENLLCPVCDLQILNWMDLIDHVEQMHLLGGQFRQGPDPADEGDENIVEREIFESVGLPRSDDDQSDIPPFNSDVSALSKRRRLNKENDVHTTEPESFAAAISKKILRHRKSRMEPLTASKRRKSFTCTGGCKMKFQRRITRDVHQLRHQEENWDKSARAASCPECYFTAANWMTLLDHVEDVHRMEDPPKPSKPPKQMMVRCTGDKCWFAFGSAELLDIHARRHVQRDAGNAVLVDTSPRCPECDCSFAEYSTLILHVESAHAIPRGKKRLQRKVRSKWFSCAECKIEFPTVELRDVHNRQHGIRCEERLESKEGYTCPAKACIFTCEQVDELLQHVTQRHSRKEHYYCSRCNFPCKSMQRLELHTQQAHLWSEAEKPFECETCHKKFARNTGLSVHLRVHSKSSYFACPLCSAAFATKARLHGHFAESHTVDGNLQCSVCGAKFPLDGFEAFRNFRHHVRRVHVETGQFECSICHKIFKRKTKLTQHTKTVHSATRDYKCECGKSFDGRDHLTSHKRRVHKEGKTDMRKLRSRKAAVKDDQSLKEQKTVAYVPPQKLKEYTKFPFYCEECRQGFCRRGMMAYHFTVRHPERSLDSVPQLTLSSTAVHLSQM